MGESDAGALASQTSAMLTVNALCDWSKARYRPFCFVEYH